LEPWTPTECEPLDLHGKIPHDYVLCFYRHF
jgi:hypothetical protein